MYIHVLFYGFLFYFFNILIFLSDFPFLPVKHYIIVALFQIIFRFIFYLFSLNVLNLIKSLLILDIMSCKYIILFYFEGKFYRIQSYFFYIYILFPLLSYLIYLNSVFKTYFKLFYVFLSKKVSNFLDKIL